MTTYFCSPTGSNGNAGTSYATRVINASVLTLSPGDNVRFEKSPDAFSTGVNGTWTYLGDHIGLASPLSATVTDCGTNWTASGGLITQSTATFGQREGSGCQQFVIDSAFTTGKVAYFTISSTDFSAFRTINAWFQNNSANFSANQFKLCLCSDTAGNTIVDEFFLDYGTDFSATWHPWVTTKGSALGTAIQSVALYVASALGSTQTVLLDYICVTPSGGISYNHLVGKNTSNETFFPIRYMTTTNIYMDLCPSINPLIKAFSYPGTTQTTTLYARLPILVPLVSGTNYQTNASSGSAGSLITYSGGWDTTNMSTQTGETWYDGRVGSNSGIAFTASYNDLDGKTGTTRFNDGTVFGSTSFLSGRNFHSNCNNRYNVYVTTSGNVELGDILGCAGGNRGMDVNANNFTFANVYNCAGNGFGIYLSVKKFKQTGTLYLTGNISNPLTCPAGSGGKLDTIIANNNTGYLDLSNRDPVYIKSFTSADASASSAILISGGNVLIGDYTTSGATGGTSISHNAVNAAPTNHVIRNATISEATKISTNFYSTADSGSIAIHKLNSSTNIQTYFLDGYIKANSSDRHTASGFAWEVGVTGSNRNKYFPIVLPLGPYPVTDTGTVTITAYIKKSHATNISARLVVYGGQCDGIASDVSTTITGTSYTQFTLTGLNPTSKTALPVYLEVWSDTGSTTNYVLIDDITSDQV